MKRVTTSCSRSGRPTRSAGSPTSSKVEKKADRRHDFCWSLGPGA
jgi:hypothetical protein